MPKIFREYIGVKPYSKSLRDFPIKIINSNISEFHFILGFANEEYDDKKRGTGVFKTTWNVEFFGPEDVKRLKENNKNVKVVISFGGCDEKTPFNPAEDNIWMEKAVASLKAIILKYKDQSGKSIIDGIDINYEHILTSIDKDRCRFAECLGQVITDLKKDRDLNINVVSIAPSEHNDSHYRKLYWENIDNINLVDYKFYNQTKIVQTSEEFVKLYLKIANDYTPDKFLPGISTDPGHTEPADKIIKMPREIFTAGCKHLMQYSTLPGIFLWNAHDSVVPPSGETKAFLLEDILQSLLLVK
jgi:hypothetical protein